MDYGVIARQGQADAGVRSNARCTEECLGVIGLHKRSSAGFEAVCGKWADDVKPAYVVDLFIEQATPNEAAILSVCMLPLLSCIK